MSIPRVHTVSIGDEILLGKTLDTNAHFLADLATARGLRVIGARVVGDVQDEMVAALRQACAQADVVLVTGGLGPTTDDRTREAVAELCGVQLQEDEAAWDGIQAYIASRIGSGRVPGANRRQCRVPVGAEVLDNDRGTAPGLLVRHADAVIACLPGVPHEMRAMAERLFVHLDALLPAWQPGHSEELHLAGIGESAVQDELADLLDGDAELTVGITAQRDGHLCIRCIGPQARVRQRLATVRERLGSHALPPACPCIADAVVQRCRERGLMLSAAESCTCGQVVAQLGAVAGVSAVLAESLVCYANEAKIRRLGVDADLIAAHGVVSEPVVAAMARGLQACTGADLAIATSGIAGPEGGSAEKPVGLVWYAVALGDELRCTHRVFPGSRSDVQDRAASRALLLAWEMLNAEAVGA